MTDKFKDSESMLPAATDKKTIKFKQPVGKTQVIINPPEKVDPQRGFQERFKTALQKHTVMMEKRTELVLQAKAARTHFPEESVKQVYIRGFKSLPLNSELTREQYAMNRVNSFIAGGAALVEDCDLLPIYERVGMKGSGGAMRPHIKREKSVYNGKTLYHVMDAKGNKKHSTTDEFAAKKHLAQKYHAYMKEEDIGKHNNGTTGFKPLVDKLTPKYGKEAAGKIAGSIKKKVMAKEDVEQIDEISTDGYHKAAIKSRQDAAVKVMSSMGSDKQAKTKLDARNRGLKRLSDRSSAEMKKANSGPQRQSVGKEPTEAERRGYGQGRYMGDSYNPAGEMVEAQSAAVRWQRALEAAKKKREEETARNAENAKRALTPMKDKE